MPIVNIEQYFKLNEEEEYSPINRGTDDDEDAIGDLGDDNQESDPDYTFSPIQSDGDDDTEEEEDSFIYDHLFNPGWSTAGYVLGGVYGAKKIKNFIKARFTDPMYSLTKGGVNEIASTIISNRGRTIEESRYLANKAKSSIVKHISLEEYKKAWKSIRVVTGKQISPKSARMLTKIVMTSKNAEDAIKNLTTIQRDLGLDKTMMKDIKSELFTKDSKKTKVLFKSKYKDLIKKGGTATGKNRVVRSAYWMARKIPGRKMFNTLSTKMFSKAGGWAITKLAKSAISPLLKLGAKLGLTVSGVGTAVGVVLLAADVYQVATWLNGDEAFFEPEEGWENGKHTKSGQRKESEKVYEMMNTSLQMAITIGKEASSAMIATFSPGFIIGPPPYEGNESFFEKDLDKYASFLANTAEAVEKNILINRFDNSDKSDDDILDMIKSDYQGYSVTGSDVDDYDIIDDVMTKYKLNTEENIYSMVLGEEAGEGVGAWIENAIGFVPGLNALGWAHLFLSEDYIDSIDKISDVDKKPIIGLIHRAQMAITMDQGNVKIEERDVARIVSALTGSLSSNTDIISDLVIGELDGDSKEMTPLGDIQDVLNVISNHINSSYSSVISRNTKVPITKGIMALSALVAVREMLRFVVLGGGAYFAIVEGMAVIAETIRDDVNKILDDAGIEADDELSEEMDQVDSEILSDMEEIEKEVSGKSGSEDQKNETPEESKNQTKPDLKVEVLSDLDGFNSFNG